MDQLHLCQSCGMPLIKAEDYGSNVDGTKSSDYCHYCFADGKFTQDITMDEMITHCLQFLDEFNKDSENKYSKEEAMTQMKSFFPTLKRWNCSHI